MTFFVPHWLKMPFGKTLQVQSRSNQEQEGLPVNPHMLLPTKKGLLNSHFLSLWQATQLAAAAQGGQGPCNGDHLAGGAALPFSQFCMIISSHVPKGGRGVLRHVGGGRDRGPGLLTPCLALQRRRLGSHPVALVTTGWLGSKSQPVRLDSDERGSCQ